jgi:hypothetical protein
MEQQQSKETIGYVQSVTETSNFETQARIGSGRSKHHPRTKHNTREEPAIVSVSERERQCPCFLEDLFLGVSTKKERKKERKKETTTTKDDLAIEPTLLNE